MKLKAIFLLLNGVLCAAFLVIFLLPVLLIGGDYFSLFWARNWPSPWYSLPRSPR